MDGLEHAPHVLRGVVVPEAQHAIACGFKPVCPRLIAFSNRSFGVLRAIDFDHQTRRHAGEISHEGPDWYLATKVRAGYR